MQHPTTFVTPVVEHWLEWEIVQWVHPMKDQSDDLSHHERTLLPRSYISLPFCSGWTPNSRSVFLCWGVVKHSFIHCSGCCTVEQEIAQWVKWIFVIPVMEHWLEQRKEMFYLTMHSTHFIYGYRASRHMVKDHSDSERKPAAATWATLSD